MRFIGEKIKELRRKNGMTQEKLADYLCVTYQTVSKWETGVTSPDLSLIVPLARLFKVTTDELFDFKESTEDMRRAELKKRYDDTFGTGDIGVRLAVCEEAVKAYPGDMKWLNDYAWTVYRKTIISCSSGSESYIAGRIKSIELFRTVIDNCENINIKADAITGIVECLTDIGNYTEAKQYAELYPDTDVSADKKDDILSHFRTDDEKYAKCQEKLMNRIRTIISNMMELPDYHDTAETGIFDIAEALIKMFIPDGNYLGFNNEFLIIYSSKAVVEIQKKNYDNAMSSLQKAREYAIAFDAIGADEFTFTAPLLNHAKSSKREWLESGAPSALDNFHAFLSVTPILEPLKECDGYAELIK